MRPAFEGDLTQIPGINTLIAQALRMAVPGAASESELPFGLPSACVS